MIGKALAQYRIDSELGRGGMGIIYGAHDSRLRRDVAIKVLSAIGGRQRLLAEARAAAALNHPGICTVYEVGEDGADAYIVMERIAGRTLREVIADGGGADARRVAQMAVQAAEALAAAHSQGIAHGDIKPANIMIAPGDRVKLLDFGIASRNMEDDITETRSSERDHTASGIAGTPAYMSPEQRLGAGPSPSSDLFSLGVTLYEWAMGQRPGQTHATLPRNYGDLARIVERLLEARAEVRYQSALELHADLAAFQRSLDAQALIAAKIAAKPSVAVVPFRVLSPNPEDQYHGVALADGLINGLSNGGRLLVRPVSLVMRYANQSPAPQDVARDLGVDTVVEGSLQRQGTRLRVSAQAWDAHDGSTRWSGRYESDVADMFGMQDLMTDELAVALGVRDAAGEAQEEHRPTSNPAALDLYLRAVDRLSRFNKWDMRTAIEMLENAVKVDPHFVEAWARLAEGCLLIANFDPLPAWQRRGEQAVKRAMALDPHHADVQCMRGRLLWSPTRRFQNAPALRALTTALRINPGCHSARVWQCLIFMHVGMHEQAREGLMLALATHPEDSFVLNFIAQTATYSGQYEEAEDYFLRVLRVDPQGVWGNVFHPSLTLYEGNLETAEQRIATSRQVLGDEPWLDACEGLLWAKRGEPKRSEKLVARALSARKTLLHTHHLWHIAACACTLNGKHTQAIALLKRCAGMGLPNYPAFRDDPHFVDLHARPAYTQLMTKLSREFEGYKREFGAVTSR